MHRSGTSLVANILEESGLFLGMRKLPPAFDNPKGYYEDTEFLDLNIKILKYNKTTHLLDKDIELTIPDFLKKEAIALIKKRESLNIDWGWKDPRNSLLLDFWAQLIPEAKFLFLFRPYEQVVDSLLRRISRTPLRRPLNYTTGEFPEKFYYRLFDKITNVLEEKFLKIDKFIIINKYYDDVLKKIKEIRFNLKSNDLYKLYTINWIIYNIKILRFIKKNQSRYLLLNPINFLKYYDNIVYFFKKNWGFNVNRIDLTNIYNPNLLKKDTFYFDKFYNFLEKDLKSIYFELLNFEKISLDIINT